MLALSHDTQKKAVSLNFTGDGKRAVKVGYVVENPIWKTSYRLILDKKNKAFLQGWAVVENTQDEDWNNVRMALVSGRPISFQMDLYQPLFVTRPVVEPELFASLRPPTYQGDDGDRSKAEPRAADAGAEGDRADKAKEARRLRMPAADASRQAVGRNSMDQAGQTAASTRAAASAPPPSPPSSATSSSTSSRSPSALPRQKSAMLPIVNQDVEGTKVSIYNQGIARQVPAAGPEVQEQHAAAPDARPHHRLRRPAATPAMPASSTCSPRKNG